MADNRKVALISGYTGQDGTFLTKLLLEKGYIVIGLVRRISTEPPMRVRGKFDFSEYIKKGQLILESGDLLSRSSLDRIIHSYRPTEIYNLAGQSHVGESFKQPEFTLDVNLMGIVNLLEALQPYEDWRMYQASTSEMFGNLPYLLSGKIDESYFFEPVSPYAIAKTAAHWYCHMKRNQGKFVACGILFNHESEIRGESFVSQKIVKAMARGQAPVLGNLEAKRDWGYAGDYVEAMWLMLQHEKPDDFVIATGKTRSVQDFVDAANKAFGTSYESIIDPTLLRPNEVGYLLGDASKAKDALGWEPKTSFEEMVKIMVEAAKESR